MLRYFLRRDFSWTEDRITGAWSTRSYREVAVWQLRTRNSQKVSIIISKSRNGGLNPSSCHRRNENLLGAGLCSSLSVKQMVANTEEHFVRTSVSVCPNLLCCSFIYSGKQIPVASLLPSFTSSCDCWLLSQGVTNTCQTGLALRENSKGDPSLVNSHIVNVYLKSQLKHKIRRSSLFKLKKKSVSSCPHCWLKFRFAYSLKAQVPESKIGKCFITFWISFFFQTSFLDVVSWKGGLNFEILGHNIEILICQFTSNLLPDWDTGINFDHMGRNYLQTENKIEN